MKIFTSITFLTFLSYYTFGQCIDSTNIVAFSFDGNNYEIVKENKTWAEAASCAVERGGILTEINSEEEQNAIFNQLNSNGNINTNATIAPDGGGGAYIWIGGNDLSVEGNWEWDGNNDNIGEQFWMGDSNGNVINGLYNNWGNEPDDFRGQDGLGLSLNGWPLGVAGEWNDVDHLNQLYFIIEYDGSATNTSDSENNLTQIELYPNPVNEYLELKLADSNFIKITLLNSSGQIIKVLNLDNLKENSIKMNTSDLQKGVYIIQAEKMNGLIFSKLLLK